MSDSNDSFGGSLEPRHRRWTCIGGGNLQCDLRKVTLWVLLIVMALATWGLWLLLGDIQESFTKRKTAENRQGAVEAAERQSEKTDEETKAEVNP